MTRENKRRQGDDHESGQRWRVCSAGCVAFLFLLFTSAASTKTAVQGVKRAVQQREAECLPLTNADNTVEIDFYGLFYFSFPDWHLGIPRPYREYGDVGILSTRKDHLFFLAYDGVRDAPVLTFPHETLQSQPEIIEISKDPDDPPGQRGVRIQGFSGDRGWGKPNDRSRDDENPTYFNWILDFEGEELHKRDLDERGGKLRPILRIKTGCFATGELSPNKYYTVQDGKVTSFGYVATYLKTVITINGDQRLKIEWDNEPFNIPRETRHIVLLNMRPEHAEYVLEKKRLHVEHELGKAVVATDTSHLSDDLHLYYDDLLRVPNRDKFYFIPDLSPGSVKKERNIPFICYGTGGSKQPLRESLLKRAKAKR